MLTGVRLCRRAASFANARTQWTNTYWNPGRGGCCTGVTVCDRAADLGLNSKDHAEIAAPQSQLRAEMATARVKDHLYILQRRPAVKSYTTVARRGCGQQSHETYATTVRSHPQLLNGRLRSTTASCGTTPASCHQDAPPNASCLDSILLRGFATRHDAAALQKPGHFGLHIFASTWVGFRGSWRWPFT